MIDCVRSSLIKP